MHYAMFGSSSSVREYMFANGVDQGVVNLNDLNFFKSVIYIIVSYLKKYYDITQICKSVGKRVWVPSKYYSRIIL